MRLFSSERTKSENRTLSRVDFNDKDSVVEFVTNRYHRRATHRQGMESQWFINIAQYLNFQHHHFDGLSRTLQEKPRPKGMVRLTCNKITPATMKFVSKFMRQKPIWTSLPATNDLEDQVKAILGTRLLRYYHRVEQLDRKLREFATWLRTTGNCFMRAAWDPDKSHEIMFEEEETQDLPPELMKIVGRQGQIYNLGDVDVRVRPPFCIDVDPSATSMEDAGWLIDSSAVPIERLRSRYGTAVSKIANDTKSGESLTAYYQKKIADMAGTGGLSGFGSDEEEEDDTVMVHELWVAPLPKTKGYHCVVAGGKILQLTKNLPSDFRVIPYGHVADIPVPGRFWGNSAIEYAIPLQASYNKGRSQMIQHRNLVLKPKILEPRGSRIGDAAFTDVAGERIQYNAPLRPDYMIGPELPETAHRILEYDLRDMEDALGVHEVCVSEDTEALTKNGWRRHQEIAIGDEILTFNVQLGISEWQPVQAMTRYALDGKIIRMSNPRGFFDFLVTPNHRWPVFSRRGVTKIVKTTELSQDMAIPKCAPLALELKEPVYTDAEVELMCWYITEGNYARPKKGRPRVRISQSRTANPAYCERIEKNLDSIFPGAWKPYPQKDGCVQYLLMNDEAARVKALVPDKRLTIGMVLNMTKAQREIAIEVMMLADGCPDSYTPRFATTEPETADAFQALVVLAGKSTSRSIHKKGRKRPIHLVSVGHRTQTNVRHVEFSEVPYNGIVWCPTSENMTWLMRRNGKVTFTGNTNSRAPSGVRAGVAITALQEQDDQTHAPVFMLAEKMLSDVGSWILQLIARNVKEERLVRIVGEEHQIDCFTFTGSDLLGQNKGKPGVNYFDVECQMGSQLPLSKAQRTQYVIDLVNSGILDRVADSKLIKKMLEIGSEEPGIKADQLDRQAARRENQLMLQGILPEPQPQDDDLIHLEELLLFMKSNQYLQGIQQDPELKMRAETHLVWTQERLNPDPTMAPPGEEEGAPPPEEGGAGSPEDLAMMLAQAG